VIADQESETGQIRAEPGMQAAIAEFIRTHGVTRCPTACVLPTQASVTAHDREALTAYAQSRDRLRRARAARKLEFSPSFSDRPPR
jgi:hypothetical protein